MDPYARDGQALGRVGDDLSQPLGLLGDKIVLSSNNNNFTKPGRASRC
jgi:hypothetical protein